MKIALSLTVLIVSIVTGVYFFPLMNSPAKPFAELCGADYAVGQYRSKENTMNVSVGEVWEKDIALSSIGEAPEDSTNLFDYEALNSIAKLTTPSGQTIEQMGFFDGGETLKFRAVLDEPGAWQYSIYLNGEVVLSEEFEVAVDNSGSEGVLPISVDSQFPNRLVTGEEPFYWIGGKWISAPNTAPCSIKEHSEIRETHQYASDENILAYLDKLASTGHNGALLKIAQYPLLSDGISWDLEWIQRIDWVVRESLKRNLYIQLNIFDTWSRGRDFKVVDDTSADQQVFNVWEPAQTDLERIQNYIRVIVARFSAYPNIMWELGNEMEHRPNCGECFVEQANKYYIPWIREADHYDRLIGLSEEIWLDSDADVGFLHQTKASTFEEITPDPRPLVMNELVSTDDVDTLWQNSTIRDPEARLPFRRTFWRSFMYDLAGSFEATWLNINEGMDAAVDDVMRDHQIFADFIANLPANINRRRSLGKIEQSDSQPYTIYGLQFDSEVRLFYLLSKSHLNEVTDWRVSLDLPEGTYAYSWFSPSTGEYSESITQVVTDNLSVVNEGSALDWVLTVTREESGGP